MDDKNIYVFTAQSPLGMVVYCTEETWNNHIVAGHSSMEAKEDEVKNAIESPSSIYESNSHPSSRDVYFAYNRLYNEYLKVVVHKFDTHSEVVSAWYQQSIRGNIGGLKYVDPKLRPKV